MECIILAGGLGTRLRGVIGDYPKCMAPVNGVPFLAYIFRYLELQGCTKVILSLGYKHEVVLDWLKTQQLAFDLSWVVEEHPLGTGGGIRLALQKAEDANVFILNGDTFFNVDLLELMSFHRQSKAETTLALKAMRNFERYGVVHVDESGHIIAFDEKKFCAEGRINGGVYVIDRQSFLARELPEKFSFEKDYLEVFLKEHSYFALTSDAYFIDIGIPEDYEQAQQDFKDLF